METHEQDFEENEPLPIKFSSKAVSEEEIKKNWEAIQKAILEIEEEKLTLAKDIK